MRLLATSACLTLFLTAMSAVPAFAKHTPAAEEDGRIENALWLSSLETWQQAYDVPGTEADKAPRVEIQELDVKTTPTEIYIIRWYTDE